MRTITFLKIILRITRSILGVRPLHESSFVLLIHSNPLEIFRDHTMFGIFNGLCIHNNFRKFHAIAEHGCTKLFFRKVANTCQKPTHPIPRVRHKGWSIRRKQGELQRILINTHIPFTKVNLLIKLHLHSLTGKVLCRERLLILLPFYRNKLNLRVIFQLNVPYLRHLPQLVRSQLRLDFRSHPHSTQHLPQHLETLRDPLPP